MNYLRKLVAEHDLDAVRINLSAAVDARTAPAGTPARHGRIRPEPQCDWCADPRPIYVYATSRMSDGSFVPPGVTCWQWMACAACNRDIEQGNWDRLERRTRARFKLFFRDRLAADYPNRPVPDSLVEQAVRQSLANFQLYAIPVHEAGGGKSATAPRGE